MKNLFLAFLIAPLFSAAPKIARAQTDEPPTPRPPYIAPVPDYGHWTVSFKYGSSAPSAPAATAPTPALAAPGGPAGTPSSSAPEGFPTTIDTIKTGELRGVVLTFASGPAKQFTCQGNWVLTSTPKGPQLVIANPTNAPYIYYTTGYILLDGVKIDPSTFQSAEKHNGVMAFHYKSGETEAWVDVATMLPVAAKQAGVEVTYQFLNPPPRPFPIPEDQASLMQKEEQSLQSTKAMR